MKPPEVYFDKKSPVSLQTGFQYVIVISSNGKDFDVRIPENIIPLLTMNAINKCVEIVADAFYTMRPDLRPQ